MREIIKWRLVLIGVFIAACFSLLNAQDLNFQKINYTIKDGLPSNECHDLLQDSLGYIWIATDRGLVRFDGYTFKSYGISDGLTNISCLDLVFDKYQNIWIHTLGGQIFKYDVKTEAITPFKYQTVIDSFLNFNAAVKDFAVDEKDNLILATLAFGFLSIQIENGSFQMIRGGHPNDFQIGFTQKIGDNLLVGIDNRRNSELKEYLDCIKIFGKHRKGWNCQSEIKHSGMKFKSQLNLSKNEAYTNQEAFQITDSISILQLWGVTYFFKNKNLLKVKTNDQYFTDIIPFEGNMILVGGIFKSGLKYFDNYHNLIDNEGKILLENISVSKILIDKENNIWASSLENGLFYLKKSLIQEFIIPEFNKPFISNIEVDNEKIYLVAEKNQLIKFQDSKFEPILIKGELRSILHKKNLDKLLVGGSKATIALNKKGAQEHFYYRSNLHTNLLPLTSNKIFLFSKSEIFVSVYNDLLKFTEINKIQVYQHQSESNKPIRVLSMEKVNSDYFLLGTAKGLRCLKKNNIEELAGCPNALTVRINAITRFENWYIFGTQGNGIYFWDLEEKHFHLKQKEGLISNNIETLFIDDQSNLFVGTKSGLSKVDLNNLDNYQIRNYTQFHGLPSNDIMDIDQQGDSILLATGKGIGVFLQEPKPVRKHHPMITAVQVNNDWFDKENVSNSFSHDKNNIKISYKSIDFKMQGTIPYRYQLNEGGWVKTMATEVNYPVLPSGKYSFQLQSQNIDKQWGNTAVFDFTIRQPWWRSTWFFVGCSIILVLFSYLFYKNKTNSLKKKLEIEREIRELERSALQAQMNPHFIFNCLNSIQNFIMDNEKENAMDYLGKFAQLIRQSLYASTQTKIPLEREIQMIQNHLDLEKLRFKNKFDYKIQIDPALNPMEINIPPLLIQPLVENSIIHGMKDKESDGWININFSKENENSIKISIQDNGTEHNEYKTSATHKSLGSSITARRLALNNKIKDSSFAIHPQYSAQGTIVDLVIQI